MPDTSPSSEDSSDIEIVSIHPSGPTKTARASFAWNELCRGERNISFWSLKKALEKYDVDASDDQILDMISLSSKSRDISFDDFLSLAGACGVKYQR